MPSRCWPARRYAKPRASLTPRWHRAHLLSTPSAAAPVRRECASSLPDQLQTATTLGLDKVGLPSSAAPIASLFGGGQAPRGGREQGGQSHRAAPARLVWCANPR